MSCPKLNSAPIGEAWLYALGRAIYRIYTSDEAEAPLIAYQVARANGLDPEAFAEDLKALLDGEKKWLKRCVEIMRMFPEERDFYALGAAALVLDGSRVRVWAKACYPDLFRLAAERLLKKWLICAPPSISLADLLGRR
ncbi:MAG: hypothetical protein QXP98_08325 [Thermoproteus sp.]